MAVIYKLTRVDGLEYIGITKRFEHRLKSHIKSLRFLDKPIKHHEILFEGEYVECERLEEHFIEKYNTYLNGLNCTRRGKGLSECDRFNTLGYKFSEESRQKMSISAKLRTDRPKGWHHSDETRKKWSQLRGGNCYRPKKLDDLQVIAAFAEFTITDAILRRYCKKTQKDLIDLTIDNAIGIGGHKLTKSLIFCREYADLHGNITHAGVARCLTRNGI